MSHPKSVDVTAIYVTTTSRGLLLWPTGWSFRGDHYRLLVRHTDRLEMAFIVEAMATDLPQPGESIRLGLRREVMTLLPPDTD